MQVTVVYSPQARQVLEWSLTLPTDATVRDALAATALKHDLPKLDLNTLDIAVWGRKARPGQKLRERDRIEVLRPLLVDPKLARRERFKKQGARTTGLFANRRAGAKPGY